MESSQQVWCLWPFLKVSSQVLMIFTILKLVLVKEIQIAKQEVKHEDLIWRQTGMLGLTWDFSSLTKILMHGLIVFSRTIADSSINLQVQKQTENIIIFAILLKRWNTPRLHSSLQLFIYNGLIWLYAKLEHSQLGNNSFFEIDGVQLE